MADVQARMIDRAAAMLKPGGTLVYCTCSLEPEEGEAQLAGAVDTQRPDADADRARPRSAASPRRSRPPARVRTLPCHAAGARRRASGMDGFFVMRLRKV